MPTTDFRVTSLSNWLALTTARGLTATQARGYDTAGRGIVKMLNIYDVTDAAGNYVVSIYKWDAGQHSRWACDMNRLPE